MERVSIQKFIKRRYSRLCKSIRISVNTALKEAKSSYQHQFNPFYGINIGLLSAEGIQKELTYYIKHQSISPNMPVDAVTQNKFSIFVTKYTSIVGLVDFEDVNENKWDDIWDSYKREVMSENFATYNMPLYDNQKQPYNENEVNEYELIEEDISSVLNKVLESDWVVAIKQEQNDIYNHRIVVINLTIPEVERKKVLITAAQSLVGFFSENYSDNQFFVEEESGKLYINGYLRFNIEYQ